MIRASIILCALVALLPHTAHGSGVLGSFSGSGSGSGSGSSSGGSSSSGSTSTAKTACKDTSKVVGRSICHRYGRWDNKDVKSHGRIISGITYLSIPTAALEVGGSSAQGRDFILTDPQLTESGRVHAIAYSVEGSREFREHVYGGVNWTFGAVYPADPRPVTTSRSGVFQLDDRATLYTSIGGIIGARANIGDFSVRGQVHCGARWISFKGGSVPLPDDPDDLLNVGDGQLFVRPGLVVDIWMTPRHPLTIGLSTDLIRRGEYGLFLGFGRANWAFDEIP